MVKTPCLSTVQRIVLRIFIPERYPRSDSFAVATTVQVTSLKEDGLMLDFARTIVLSSLPDVKL